MKHSVRYALCVMCGIIVGAAGTRWLDVGKELTAEATCTLAELPRATVIVCEPPPGIAERGRGLPTGANPVKPSGGP